jgi:nitrogen-specific signal transduction histidine kinase
MRMDPTMNDLERILDHLNTSVLLVDRRQVVSYLNVAAETLLGLSDGSWANRLRPCCAMRASLPPLSNAPLKRGSLMHAANSASIVWVAAKS